MLAALLSLLVASAPPAAAPPAAAPPAAAPPVARPPVAAPPAPAAPPSAAPAAPQLRSVPITPPRFEMQAPGAEPRRLLRPALVEGTRLPLEMVVEGIVNRYIDDAPPVGIRPLPVRWTIDLTVRRVTTSGGFVLAGTVAGAEPVSRITSDSAQVDALIAVLVTMRGAPIELELSPLGGLLELRLPESAFQADALPDELRRLAEALTMVFRPLPADPVGTGARWQSRVDRALGGIDRIEVATGVVEKIDDEGVSVRMTDDIRPAKTRPSLPDGRVPEAKFVVLEQLDGFGKGTARWSGRSFLPERLTEQIFVPLFAEGTLDSGARRRLHEQELVSVRIAERRPR